MNGIAHELIKWQRVHGRHELPWQGTRDPYPIWVSEIMLQQTQVSTVIPYYERFITHFPDVLTLAQADLDEVLAHWSGLGYYSRARNLHRAAAVIRDAHAGRFPREFDAVTALPGIGRSTAGAIMVFAFGARHPILDGNVKRVLARVCGIDGYPDDRATAEALWRAAEALLPDAELERYTQGLMDLGASLCRRTDPLCSACPLSASCIGRREHRTREIPAPRPPRRVPHRRTVMAIMHREGKLLLEKRPPAGIWGGLWCFPECIDQHELERDLLTRFGVQVDAHASRCLPDVRHGFTHFDLTITPHWLDVRRPVPVAAEADHQWLAMEEIGASAVPAPVRRIIEALGASADPTAAAAGVSHNRKTSRRT